LRIGKAHEIHANGIEIITASLQKISKDGPFEHFEKGSAKGERDAHTHGVSRPGLHVPHNSIAFPQNPSLQCTAFG
jgi:hypothetical protein